MKKRVSVILFIVLCAAVIGVFTAYGEASDAQKCREFLSSYGWEIEPEPTSHAQITLPAVFDKVYENYNEIQKTSGLDLLPYCGKSGTRYTFKVTNYPIDVGETVYANVIIIDGTPIGGDIMTVSLSGFMHGLDERLSPQLQSYP